MLSSVILVVGLMMLSSTVAMISRQRSIQRENAIAAEGARTMIERMRGQALPDIFALFNDDPSDDPGGAGTAPGAHFEIGGLRPQDGDADGLVGEIRFPVIDVAAAGDPTDLELREDLVDPDFGTPRDLSGDSIIDRADHTGDYFLLPVQVRVRWIGKAGNREFRTFTTFCDFNWG